MPEASSLLKPGLLNSLNYKTLEFNENPTTSRHKDLNDITCVMGRPSTRDTRETMHPNAWARLTINESYVDSNMIFLDLFYSCMATRNLILAPTHP